MIVIFQVEKAHYGQTADSFSVEKAIFANNTTSAFNLIQKWLFDFMNDLM